MVLYICVVPKMRKIHLILLILITISSCKTFDYKSRFEEKYIGNPKKIQITFYDVIEIDDTIKKGKMKYSEISFFDKKNRIFKDYSINSKGDTIGKKCERLFNKKELTIKSVCYTDSTENILSIYKLHKNFKKSIFEFYHNNKLSGKRIFEYASNKIDYVDFGYDKNNKLKDKTLIIHDKKGRIIKSTSYNLKDNSIKNIIEHKYDKNGNEYEQNWYKKEKKLFTSYTNRKFDDRNNYIYGEKLFFKNSDTIKSITTIEYKYDKKGNIIYRLINTHNQPSLIEERKITY
jgi:hypothetical protein